MSIETHKYFLGKTQTILMAETQSERWVSRIRITLGSILLLLSLTSLLLGAISLPSFLIQLTAIILLFSYSAILLFQSADRLLKQYFPYVLISFDAMVITAILGSYQFGGSSPPIEPGALFCAYLVGITCTALHNRIGLSIASGIASSIGYSMLFWLGPPTNIEPSVLAQYFIRVALLLTVAVIAGIASRNNFFSVQRVISSEIRYQNLVHRLPEMLFTLDARGTFLWANMASHAILGVPSKILPSRSIREFLVNPDAFKFDRGGIKGTFEVQDFEKKRKFVDCIIQSAREAGSETAWEGIMFDVTDRELAIAQREEMVQRLFHYQKMESLSTLASGMAHDFNNTLQIIRDVTDITQKETPDPQTRKRMEIVLEAVSDAQFLTSELLAFGRKKPLNFKRINLISFFESLTAQLSGYCSANQRVDFRAPGGELWIQGDVDYLKRVFQNLFGNSRDAMPDGGTVSIECFAQRRGSDPGSIVIYFSDTGSGIPEEIRDRIYEPFFSTKKSGKGTGLGLALSQRVVSMHGGTITLDKSDSTGTIFRIEIPESQAEIDIKDDTTVDQKRLTTTVVVLDDDPKIRRILKVFLQDLEYAVVETVDRDEAISALKKNYTACDLIIMDWKLANEDPLMIIETLRALKPQLQVMVVSGYPAPDGDLGRFNIHKWFTKPYDKNQLDLEIQKVLHSLKK